MPNICNKYLCKTLTPVLISHFHISNRRARRILSFFFFFFCVRKRIFPCRSHHSPMTTTTLKFRIKMHFVYLNETHHNSTHTLVNVNNSLNEFNKICSNLKKNSHIYLLWWLRFFFLYIYVYYFHRPWQCHNMRIHCIRTQTYTQQASIHTRTTCYSAQHIRILLVADMDMSLCRNQMICEYQYTHTHTHSRHKRHHIETISLFLSIKRFQAFQ